jgi:hypothetical protein
MRCFSRQFSCGPAQDAAGGQCNTGFLDNSRISAGHLRGGKRNIFGTADNNENSSSRYGLHSRAAWLGMRG